MYERQLLAELWWPKQYSTKDTIKGEKKRISVFEIYRCVWSSVSVTVCVTRCAGFLYSFSTLVLLDLV